MYHEGAEQMQWTSGRSIWTLVRENRNKIPTGHISRYPTSQTKTIALTTACARFPNGIEKIVDFSKIFVVKKSLKNYCRDVL